MGNRTDNEYFVACALLKAIGQFDEEWHRTIDEEKGSRENVRAYGFFKGYLDQVRKTAALKAGKRKAALVARFGKRPRID